MRGKQSRITLAQVEHPGQKPRNAAYRDEFAVPNSVYLFEEMNEEVRREDGLRLIHIIHGYQTLNFAHLALPHPKQNKNVWTSPNLMKIPHEITTDLPPAEGPSDSPTPEGIENLERRMRDDE
jgi:hypothetical protein